jgi:lipopolysaccharide/colanic/teichoic acid biosynthesis glycosyltransferase
MYVLADGDSTYNFIINSELFHAYNISAAENDTRDQLIKKYANNDNGLSSIRSSLYFLLTKLLWRLSVKSMVALKRIMDIIVSLFLIIILSPLFLVTAIAIWIEDPGAIIYRQTRVGKWGRLFTMYKFRSMKSNAHEMRKNILSLNEMDEVIFKIKNDPRVTRIGKVIRKFSIDELPQLWNVLIGDMSMVGPRPPLPEEVEKYSHTERKRLDVTPGLTCIWQVSGRSNINFEQQIQMDVTYIENQSLKEDIKLLLKTIPAVILCRGAY